MRKIFITAACALVLLSSCNSYTGAGAYTGATFGSILGSAIGGLGDGPRGSDLGTIIGMAGGAVVGAAIGSQADQAEKQEVKDHYDRVQQNKQRGINPYSKDDKAQTQQYGQDESGFDSSNSGDDRIYDFQGSDYTGNYSAAQPETNVPAESSVESIATGLTYAPNIEIVNARFVDDNEDGVLSSGETGKVIFEVMNRGQQPVFDIQPNVFETTNNQHIYVSPGIHVESINPGGGIRYTAMVKADKKLRAGNANFALTVLQGKKSISKVTEFNIPTKK